MSDDSATPKAPQDKAMPALASRPFRRPKITNGGFPPWKMAVLIRCKAEEVHKLYYRELVSQRRIALKLGVGEPTIKRMFDWMDQFAPSLAAGDFEPFEKELFKKYPRYKEEDFYKNYVVDCKWPIQKKRGPKPGSRQQRRRAGDIPAAIAPVSSPSPEARLDSPPASGVGSIPPVAGGAVKPASPSPAQVAAPLESTKVSQHGATPGTVLPMRSSKRSESDELANFFSKKTP